MFASLLLLATLQQSTPQQPVVQEPVGQTSNDAARNAALADVLLNGGVQAPTQPTGRSSAAITRTSRFAPQNDGFTGRINAPIGSLVAVRGQETNVVAGVGLVTGLPGTGDSGELAKQLLANLLLTQNVNIDVATLNSKNLAVVRVEAEITSGMKPGRRIDVRVSTIGDAKSLLGGTLTLSELTDLTGSVVYATAAGPVTVGGFAAEGEAASASKNIVTVGVLPGGGKIEREIKSNVVSEHGFIYLDAMAGQDSFGNIVKITEVVNSLYPGVATALPDGKTVRVRVPDDLPVETHVAYLDTILKQEVVSDNRARVVINERTGVIVIGGDVRLRPGAIAHGALIVTIAESPEASQPGPFSGGSTQELDRSAVQIEEQDNALVLVPGAVTLQEVVDVLNVLGATPRDMISILTAMHDGGLLVAEIRRM